MSMGPEPERLQVAAEEFNRRLRRADGVRVASALVRGLDLLRDLLYLRLHEDVEREVGRDSMLMPVSEIKTRLATLKEIECYQVAESSVFAEGAGYVGRASGWYGDWLALLRLDQRDPGGRERVALYVRRSADERRLDLTDNLVKVLPESSHAPLVLFRLVPLAVQIVTALGFQDGKRAEQAREEQRRDLPAIGDCVSCRGGLLDLDRACPRCGNPLWKYDLLTSGA